VFGESMNYWDFFPAPEGWGRMPVWGFAEVEKSSHDEVREGMRVYGYLPPSTHLAVVPERIDEHGFIDGAPHRANLPSAYQGYRSVDADPAYDASREDEQILFWPLFYTSFLVDDFLADEEFFGARTIVLSSASSKTAVIAAYLLAQREGIELVGLTSSRNTAFVEDLAIYHRVATYGEIDSLPDEKAVYADFSGDAEVRTAIHRHYGDSLAHSSAVGATHWEQMAGSEELPGPRPTFFFAPDRIKVRGAAWGTGGLESRVADAWKPFDEWTRGWLDVRHGSGPDHVKETYLELLEGRTDPKVGHVVTLQE
jgi:hypothetical protein